MNRFVLVTGGGNEVLLHTVRVREGLSEETRAYTPAEWFCEAALAQGHDPNEVRVLEGVTREGMRYRVERRSGEA